MLQHPGTISEEPIFSNFPRRTERHWLERAVLQGFGIGLLVALLINLVVFIGAVLSIVFVCAFGMHIYLQTDDEDMPIIFWLAKAFTWCSTAFIGGIVGYLLMGFLVNLVFLDGEALHGRGRLVAALDSSAFIEISFLMYYFPWPLYLHGVCAIVAVMRRGLVRLIWG